MHHRMSQHVKKPVPLQPLWLTLQNKSRFNASQSESDPLYFVYFSPQLGRKKRSLPNYFMGKSYFPGKAGDKPFVREKAFYEEKPFSAKTAFITSKLNSY